MSLNQFIRSGLGDGFSLGQPNRTGTSLRPDLVYNMPGNEADDWTDWYMSHAV